MRLPTPLRPGPVRDLLVGPRFAHDLRMLGIVGSTSGLLIGLARQGAEDGIVLVAEEQTAGRGRRGARWWCPAGQGLLLSVLLRDLPPVPLSGAAAAVAVARAVEEEGVPAGIKWPNDVLVGRRKVAGCLADLGTDSAGRPFAVIGIGLNVNQGPGDLPSEAPIPAGSLSLATGRTVLREPLLARLLDALEAALEAATSREADILAEYRSRDALTGARVTAREGDRVVEGTALEAHPVSGLLIRTETGREERLRAEHTHVLRFEPA